MQDQTLSKIGRFQSSGPFRLRNLSEFASPRLSKFGPLYIQRLTKCGTFKTRSLLELATFRKSGRLGTEGLEKARHISELKSLSE